MAGILYLVATPIGNLGDISRRTAETLAAVDFIAAESSQPRILYRLRTRNDLVLWLYQHKHYIIF